MEVAFLEILMDSKVGGMSSSSGGDVMKGRRIRRAKAKKKETATEVAEEQ